MKFKNVIPLLLAAMLSLSVHAADRLVRIETRPGVKVPFYYMKRDGATATLILLPGGAGGIGIAQDGKPAGANFLVRSRDLFADAGFDIADMSRASEQQG